MDTQDVEPTLSCATSDEEGKNLMLVEVAKALILMKRILRYPPEEIDDILTEAWARLLWNAQFGPDDVMPACFEWMNNESDFPTPAEIIEIATELRRRRQR